MTTYYRIKSQNRPDILDPENQGSSPLTRGGLGSDCGGGSVWVGEGKKITTAGAVVWCVNVCAA